MTETTARPVFVLGDSRTGTMTLHKFFQSAGFNSVHYFFKESGVTEPAHVDYAGNWDRLRAFIDGSGAVFFRGAAVQPDLTLYGSSEVHLGSADGRIARHGGGAVYVGGVKLEDMNSRRP